jgi:ribonuclease P protein component
MVPKKSRIPRGEFRSGGYRTFKTPFFSLKTRKNAASRNRIGIIVGKSVDKRAVRRNFLKRQAKAELLRAPNLGNDVVLVVFPSANVLTKVNFKKEIAKAIRGVSVR